MFRCRARSLRPRDPTDSLCNAELPGGGARALLVGLSAVLGGTGAPEPLVNEFPASPGNMEM